MIGYVSLGTNKFDEAAKFYDELFATFDPGRVMEGDTFVGAHAPAVCMREQGS